MLRAVCGGKYGAREWDFSAEMWSALGMWGVLGGKNEIKSFLRKLSKGRRRTYGLFVFDIERRMWREMSGGCLGRRRARGGTTNSWLWEMENWDVERHWERMNTLMLACSDTSSGEREQFIVAHGDFRHCNSLFLGLQKSVNDSSETAESRKGQVLRQGRRGASPSSVPRQFRSALPSDLLSFFPRQERPLSCFLYSVPSCKVP